MYIFSEIDSLMDSDVLHTVQYRQQFIIRILF